MSPRVVCDASALIALLLDAGPDGQWASQAVSDHELTAPTLIGFECANIIRQHELAGLISSDLAAQAHADLLALPIELWPYELVGHRVWELRHNLSSYDASYVAVAELIDADLITLDRRLSRTPGVRCRIQVPSGGS